MIVSEKVLLGVTLCVGLIVGFLSALAYEQTKYGNTQDCQTTHKFLDPTINCIDSDGLNMAISGTQSTLEDEIAELISEKKVSRVSLFYRDLKSRRWFGINQDVPFAPGSLLKLPLAIAYFKLSEVDPRALSQQILFKSSGASLNEIQNIKPKNSLIEGKNYTVFELITRMIEQSDNDPVMMLSDMIGKEYFEKVNLDLGVHFPTSGGIEQDFVSVRTYASILRSLYLASYLNTSNSEALLKMMVSGDFKTGLGAGLPKGIVLANKFGDRSILNTDTNSRIYQLHDCGIIYHPDHPYILCVMTEGSDFKNLQEVIGELSRTVYERQ